VSALCVEPNLLTHTAHSVSKKGVKKRDLDDEELRQIVTDLLSCIRVEYVLPANSEALLSALRRGLVCVPPSHFLSEEASQSSAASLWIHSRQRGALPPRLFIPYYEEAKVYWMLVMKFAEFCPDIGLKSNSLQSCWLWWFTC
jgi:BTB/POZ domain-containing protein 7